MWACWPRPSPATSASTPATWRPVRGPRTSSRETGSTRSFMGRAHKRWGTPWIAILIMGVVDAILVKGSFGTLIVIDVFLLMFSYIPIFIAAIALRVREPGPAAALPRADPHVAARGCGCARRSPSPSTRSSPTAATTWSAAWSAWSAARSPTCSSSVSTAARPTTPSRARSAWRPSPAEARRAHFELYARWRPRWRSSPASWPSPWPSTSTAVIRGRWAASGRSPASR